MTAPFDRQAMRERHRKKFITDIRGARVEYCDECSDRPPTALVGWPCDAIQDLDALDEARKNTLAWAAKHYDCDTIGADCPGRCIARCEDPPNLRVTIASVRAKLAEVESRAREVLRTGEETERELAREKNHISTMRQEHAALLADMREELQVHIDRIATLEADLAAMRGALERIEHETNPRNADSGSVASVVAEVHQEATDALNTPLAFSPGAAPTDRYAARPPHGPVCELVLSDNEREAWALCGCHARIEWRGGRQAVAVWLCKSFPGAAPEKDPVCLTCAREGEHCGRCRCCRPSQTAEAMPEGWRETAREVVDLLIAHHESWERGEDGDALDAPTRALLARPEVQGMRGR